MTTEQSCKNTVYIVTVCSDISDRSFKQRCKKTVYDVVSVHAVDHLKVRHWMADLQVESILTSYKAYPLAAAADFSTYTLTLVIIHFSVIKSIVLYLANGINNLQFLVLKGILTLLTAITINLDFSITWAKFYVLFVCRGHQGKGKDMECRFKFAK